LALENYVKFLRGTPNAYKNLAEKDSNTLYFISEKDASTGVLYLGNTMLIGGEVNTTDLKLEDLQNVLIDAGVSAGNILTFNGTNWVNSTLDEMFAVMQGASELADGVAGLVPAPKANEHNLFLKGDGTWADTGVAALNEEVQDLKTVVGIPASDENEATGLFAKLEEKANKEDVVDLKGKVDVLIGEDVDKSVKEIALATLSEALIPENAKESLNTLEELAAWIQAHPEDASEMSIAIKLNTSEIERLDSELKGLVKDFDEIAKAQQANLEKINKNISDIEGLNTKATNLEDALALLSTQVGENKNDIVDIKAQLNNFVSKEDYSADIKEIKDALTWKNIEDVSFE
jgi:hypothetical protein